MKKAPISSTLEAIILFFSISFFKCSENKKFLSCSLCARDVERFSSFSSGPLRPEKKKATAIAQWAIERDSAQAGAAWTMAKSLLLFERAWAEGSAQLELNYY